ALARVLLSDAALLLLRAAAGGVPGYLAVECRVIGRYAELFSEFRAGNQVLGSFNCPGSRVYLGIGNRDFGFQYIVFGPAPTLGNLHFIAVYPAAVRLSLAEPAPVFITVGFDDESVAFPMTDIPAHPPLER